jgi:hypothetical protein
MGGKINILSNSSNTKTIHCYQSFPNNDIQKDFENVQSWVQEQLIDVCKEQQIDPLNAIDYLKQLKEKITIDPSGKLLWDQITEQSPKIQLHSSPKINAKEEINLCIINPKNVEHLKEEISFFENQIIKNGYLIINRYNESLYPEIVAETKKLLESTWEFQRRGESLGVYKKLI